jgi:hypothetical protein
MMCFLVSGNATGTIGLAYCAALRLSVETSLRKRSTRQGVTRSS